MDDIEYEAVRRLLPCDFDQKAISRAAKTLGRSPQYLKEILAKRTLRTEGEKKI